MMDNAARPAPVYAMFVGSMDSHGAKRIIDGLAAATKFDTRTPVHLALQSSGGFVGEGIMLYEAFRGLPIDLTVYNLGGVLSIAAIAFMGARKRKASEHAAFMLHRSSRTVPQPATVEMMSSLTESMVLDNRRTESIIRKHLRLTEVQLAAHLEGDLWLSAQDALAAGMIDEIVPFTPPLGSHVFSI